jgi:cobalamin-dependent methionine synthase I
MIIVGELINASRKGIAALIEAQDKEAIQKVALDQLDNNADYIDVNAGIYAGKETEYLKWLVTSVQEKVDAPCCIDSADPKVVEAALAVHKGTAMINSISLEKDRHEGLLPVVRGTDLKVVALCTSDEGIPETVEDKMAVADKLINSLVQNNVPVENIYVDLLVQPISTKNHFGLNFLNAVEKIMSDFEGVHTICGLSNISYGLPERFFLNQTFLVMAITSGLDAAIVDPLDRRLMSKVVAAEALMGMDRYCMNYLKAYRAKKLET